MIKSISPADFIDRVIKFNEKAEPWKLAPHQRRVLELAFRRGLKGELLYRVVVLSEPKKSGKTFIAACLALWWAITTRHTEIIVCANDREQAESRVFRTMADLIETNEALKAECEVYSREIVFNNGTIVTAISSDFKGAAGSRHSLVIYDGLWGFELESSRRLYEELTPPPTEASACILIVTYAGFSGESDLLESIYNRGWRAGGLILSLSATRRKSFLCSGAIPRARSGRTKPITRVNEKSYGPTSFKDFTATGG
jgi:hypothetical protein